MSFTHITYLLVTHMASWTQDISPMMICPFINAPVLSWIFQPAACDYQRVPEDSPRWSPLTMPSWATRKISLLMLDISEEV